MANLLDRAPVVHEREVTPPAVPPARLESPTSPLLPRTVAGRQRLNPGWIIPTSSITAPKTAVRSGRLDWTEIGMIALALASATLAVYRLGWAVQP